VRRLTINRSARESLPPVSDQPKRPRSAGFGQRGRARRQGAGLLVWGMLERGAFWEKRVRKAKHALLQRPGQEFPAQECLLQGRNGHQRPTSLNGTLNFACHFKGDRPREWCTSRLQGCKRGDVHPNELRGNAAYRSPGHHNLQSSPSIVTRSDWWKNGVEGGCCRIQVRSIAFKEVKNPSSRVQGRGGAT